MKKVFTLKAKSIGKTKKVFTLKAKQIGKTFRVIALKAKQIGKALRVITLKAKQIGKSPLRRINHKTRVRISLPPANFWHNIFFFCKKDLTLRSKQIHL
jgi:hypothetical protein